MSQWVSLAEVVTNAGCVLHFCKIPVVSIKFLALPRTCLENLMLAMAPAWGGGGGGGGGQSANTETPPPPVCVCVP